MAPLSLRAFPAVHDTQYVAESCNDSEVATSTKYFPDGQTVQLEEADDSAYVPAAQIRQEAADTAPSFGLYRPLEQSVQVADEVAPAKALYFPLEQVLQEAEPCKENVPAEQDVQEAEPCKENVPAEQDVQSERASWADVAVVASAKYDPAGQPVQAADATEAAYVPAVHVKHWLDEVWAEAVVAESDKYVPIAQREQSARAS